MINHLTLKPPAFGLSISATSLSLAKVDKKENEFLLSIVSRSQVNSEIMGKGRVQDPKAFAKEIRKLIRGTRLKTNHVNISLPEERFFIKVVELNNMSKSDVGNAISNELENHIPFFSEEVYFDFEIIGFSERKNGIKVLIAAIPKNVVDSYLDPIKNADLKPRSIESELHSLSRIVLEGDSGLGVLINVNKNGTSFNLFFQGKIYSSLYSEKMNVNTLSKVDLSEKAIIDEVKKYFNFYKDFSNKNALDLNSSSELESVFINGNEKSRSKLGELIDEFFEVEVKPIALNKEVKNKFSNTKNILTHSIATGAALRDFN